MTELAKISIKNLNFYFDKQQVIKDLNLEITENSILGIFGPANSGTTTLLRTLNRMSDLTSGARMEGKIFLNGENIYSPGLSIIELRRKVGMVFEVPTPLPMSIFDNIAYGPRLSGIKNKASLEEIVENTLQMAVLWDEVKDRLHTPAMSLSGGQQQRLCLARVLALNPEVILLDRPCSGLDPVSTSKVEESLKCLKEKFTIVIVPHNVQQAGRVSDRVAFMLMGSLIEEGLAVEVFANPKDKRTSDYITGRFG
ncbi:MAG: phosphate ABC transporter ATP-binding protein PstB [Dehalococcoidales bacterium]|nr:phosphate ABC transporter ATP-binding protein PstB [Dehalococcoidales bacterium]